MARRDRDRSRIQGGSASLTARYVAVPARQVTVKGISGFAASSPGSLSYKIFTRGEDTGITGTGDLQCQESSVSSSGSQYTQFTVHGLCGFARSLPENYNLYEKSPSSGSNGTGGLVSGVSVISGTGEIEHAGTGSLAAGLSSLSGTGHLSESYTDWYNSYWFRKPTYGDNWYGTAVIEYTGTGSLGSSLSDVNATVSIERTGTGSLVSEPVTISGIAGIAPQYNSGNFSSTKKEGDTIGSWTESFIAVDVKGATAVWETIGDTPDNLTLSYINDNGYYYNGTLANDSGGDYNVQVRVTTDFGSIDSPVFPWHILDIWETTAPLASLPSTISGTGSIEHTGNGSLDSEPSVIDATVYFEVSGSGSLSAGESIVDAFGSASGIIAADGHLISQPSYVSGLGYIENTGTGYLSSESSVINATGDVEGQIGGTGNLAAGVSAINATVIIEPVGTGDLEAGVSTVSGTGEIEHTAGSVSLESNLAVVSGSGAREVKSSVSLTSEPSIVYGLGGAGTAAGGSLISENSIIAGVGIIERVGTGNLASDVSNIAAIGAGAIVITGSGALSCRLSTISGYDDISSVITYKKGTITVTTTVVDLTHTADGVEVDFVDTDYDIEFSYGYVIVDYLPYGIDVEVNYG